MRSTDDYPLDASTARMRAAAAAVIAAEKARG